MATKLEDAYGGGGYPALQPDVVLQLGWDHVASELDAREFVFELDASEGLNAWRAQLRAWFPSYDALADGVQLLDVELPP